MMKRAFRSPKLLFGLLQAVSVLAIAGGLWLSIHLILHQSPLPAGYTAGTGLCNVLWCLAWGVFIGMCRRLQGGASAFTAANSRTLMIIALAVTGMAGAVCLMGIGSLTQAVTLTGVILAVILPGTFLTVALLAFILRRLLDNAMALEEAQADVI